MRPCSRQWGEDGAGPPTRVQLAVASLPFFEPKLLEVEAEAWVACPEDAADPGHLVVVSEPID